MIFQFKRVGARVRLFISNGLYRSQGIAIASVSAITILSARAANKLLSIAGVSKITINTRATTSRSVSVASASGVTIQKSATTNRSLALPSASGVSVVSQRTGYTEGYSDGSSVLTSAGDQVLVIQVSP